MNNKWISVKDRLPKTDNKVLVYPDSGGVGHYTVHSSKKWVYSGEAILVTHWMPWPEPPQEALP